MSVDTGILDQVTQQFLQALKQDGELIQQAAKHLFYYLVVIQLSLSALWMSLAGESFQRFILQLVQLAFSFGFFYGLIQFGGQWVPDVINGFIVLGQKAGVTSLDPSSIVSQGASISGAIFKGFFGWGLLNHVFVSLVGAVVCIAIIILYALIAAELAIILVKSYVVVATGGLFFAFGASDYTRAMAMNYCKAAIGLGLNLMTLYLLLGVGQNLGAHWATMTAEAAKNHELMPMFVILAAVIVYYMILKNVPPFIAGLAGVGGFRNYGGAAVGMAINAGMSGASLLLRGKALAAKGVFAATQVGQGVYHAGRSALQGFTQSAGGLSGLAKATSYATKNIASAGANTVRDMATRRERQLTAGQKFTKHLANKVRSMNQPASEED